MAFPAVRWLQAVSQQSRPADAGPSKVGLAISSINLLVTKRPSETFLREAAAVLAAAGVGVINDTVLLSSESTLPEDKACVLLIDQGGPPGLRTHNRTGSSYERAALQVLGYAPDYEAAMHIAWQAMRALEQVENADIVPADFA